MYDRDEVDRLSRAAQLQMQRTAQACNCIGPQPGEPLCPCQMRGLVQRDGRWIRPEQDLGPVRTTLKD